MKKLIAALAASAFLMSAPHAQTVPAPQIAARSWLLLDATSGQIIASQDPDMRIEPASLTKVMTAYVTFQAIRDKKLALDQMVNVSVRAWKVDGKATMEAMMKKMMGGMQDAMKGAMEDAMKGMQDQNK